jgi:hypothetical protein
VCATASINSSTRPESLTERYPYQPPTGQKCRVFLSHAGEQKKLFVDSVRERLGEQYPLLKVVPGGVFMDELSLPGAGAAMKGIYDSLRDAFVGELHPAPSNWCVGQQQYLHHQLLSIWNERASCSKSVTALCHLGAS